MPKITEEPLEVLQVRLFKADLDRLRQIFGPEFGVNKAIRAIVRTYLRQVEAKAAEAIDKIEAQEMPRRASEEQAQRGLNDTWPGDLL